MSVKINRKLVSNVICAVGKGLGSGLGSTLGEFCVEQCVDFAVAKTEDPDLDPTSRKFSDGPTCVDEDLRSFKINLNDDLDFSSNKDRANALRRIAVAQLGTNSQAFHYSIFEKLLSAEIEKLVRSALTKSVVNTYPLKGAPKTLADFEKVRQWIDDDVAFDEVDTSNGHNIEDIFSNYSLINNSGAQVFGRVVDLIARNKMQRKAVRNQLIELAVQVLKKMKTPGSKFLHLTEKKAKKH